MKSSQLSTSRRRCGGRGGHGGPEHLTKFGVVMIIRMRLASAWYDGQEVPGVNRGNVMSYWLDTADTEN